MNKYHIIASKEIKECKCGEGKCRAKHGSFLSKKEAQQALRKLKSTSSTKKTATKVTTTKAEEPVVAEESLVEEPTEVDSDSEETLTDEDAAEVDEAEDEEEAPERPVADESLVGESYWDDDEEFLLGDDKQIDLNKDSGIFKQTEGIIRWDIDNFFDDSGERRGKYSLRQDPPILRIEDSSESVVEFVLTKEVTHSLFKALEMVDRGYYGVGPKREKGDPKESKLLEITTWLETNPVKAILLLVFVVTVFLIAFII